MALTQISTEGIKNGTITGSDLATNVDLVDNQKIRFGTGNDLQIYHTSDTNVINNTSKQLHISSSSDNLAKFIPDGAVELYHDNSKKFETTSTGANVTGALSTTSLSATGGITGTGGNFILGDNDKIKLGASQDLQIYHDGNSSFISNTTGDLTLLDQSRIKLRSNQFVVNNYANDESIIYAAADGEVSLYHNGSKKFDTTSAGVSVTGNLDLPDNTSGNASLRLGTSQDFFMNHNGTDSFIINNTGDLYIRDLNGDVHIQGKDNEESIIAKADGAVELYHDNSKKLHTKSSGIQVEGSGIFNGPGGNTTSLQLKNATDTDGTKLGHSSNSNAGFIQVTESNAGFNMQVGGPHDSNLRFQCLENSGNTQLVFGTEKALVAVPNGAIELYHDNVKRFETDSNGVRVVAPEGEQAILRLLGDEADDADDSFRLNAGGGTLKIQDASNQSFWEDNIVINAAGSVELYYNNVKMLDTSSQGVNFRGEIRSASTSSSLSNCTLKNESTGADGTDYFQCRTDNNSLRLVIEPDGDVKNQNNSYGQISDLKLKENIVDANSQWNDIKAIKVRNFNFKESTGFSTHTQIGVVAQELEIISPHLVYESTDRDPNTNVDLGTKTKNVRYSVMYMKAIKCLQEAMAKIEVLETEVAALKAA